MTRHVVLFHHPRCSKSRQALALLEENGIEPEVVEYLRTPPSVDHLRELRDKLRVTAHDMLRTKESEYAEAGLSDASSDDEIFQAIADAPVLLERPVVVAGAHAVIARPPEKLLELVT